MRGTDLGSREAALLKPRSGDKKLAQGVSPGFEMRRNESPGGATDPLAPFQGLAPKTISTQGSRPGLTSNAASRLGQHTLRGLAGLTLGVLSTIFLLTAGAAPPPQRVVAIGDIHGDLDAFIGILQRAHLVDPSRRWSGGNTTVVQTGDFLDRGPKARSVMDLLMTLQRDAARQSGHVIVLMGNHEAMNIYGDLRYVTDSDYASFAHENTDAKTATRHKVVYPSRPPGFVERCEALDADGRYGKWIRTLPAVARINDSIFLHGGISPELAGWAIEKINDEISAEIKSFDAYKQFMVEKKVALPCNTLDELTNAARAALEKAKGKDAEILKGFLGYGGWLSIAENGPLWFRGYAQWTDDEGAPQIQRLTQAFDAARFVVGHTPQAGQIISRFGGKVFLIDTGMLSSYFTGGRASALEIRDGKISFIY